MKIMRLAVFLVMTVILTACAPAVQTSESFAMDTICTQQVWGGNAAAAVKDVNAMLQNITNTMSTNEGSQVYAVNASAPQPAAVSDELAGLIGTSLQMAALTDGAFDPTIGPITALWDITGSPRVPSPGEISAALPLVDYTKAAVDGNSVTLDSGMMLDLGGIAKGYAADKAVEIYAQHGVTSALLNLGGNIYAYGQKQDGGDFRIGLRDPFGGAGEYAAVVSVHDTSVVTSGVYERYFESDGQTYHHLFDPETGYPCDNGLKAVTVICASSTQADALSTALFVLGPEEGLKLAEQLDGVEAVFFTDDHQIYVTSGLAESIEITNEAFILNS